MKNNPLTIMKYVFVILFGIAIFNACNTDSKKSNKVEESTYTSTQTDPPCACEDNWFPHDQTPAPDEGSSSPFNDGSKVNNCDFYHWAYQKFLWATKPVNDIPLFLNQDSIIQVSDAMEVIEQQAGANVVLELIHQAGGDKSLLYTNPLYSGGSNALVYYSIHTSPTMFNAAATFRKQLADEEIPPNNYEVFPVGSAEYKVSWVDASLFGSNVEDTYLTTSAAVMNDDSTYTNKDMVMLGFHVVGVVQNHPEFVWATFEHQDMAPFYDWAANSASSSNEQLLFSAGSTSGLKGITYDTNTLTGEDPYKMFGIFKYGVPADSNGILINKTSQEEPLNYNNIDSLNQCVAYNLAKEEDVISNYFLNGGLWISTGTLNPQQQAELIVELEKIDSFGNASPGNYTRGSLSCYNVSMESFRQTGETDINEVNVNTLFNCFTCHGASGYAGTANYMSPLYLSHIFDASVHLSQGKTIETIRLMKGKQQRDRIARKLKRK